ncbi:MAG: hypothetical protein II674_09195 [Prevotella sp.]|nr:hypothetical protein [Prevotella sp.]
MEAKSIMTASMALLITSLAVTARAPIEPSAVRREGQQKQLVAEGRAWVVEASDGKVLAYLVDGDTVVGARPCMKVMEWRIVPQWSKPSYHCAVCEEDGKVWMFPPGASSPDLLYDFKAGPGDEVVTDEGVWVDGYGYWGRVARTIDHIDHVTVDGRKFKRQFVNDEQGNLVDVWVEGVGGSSLFGQGLRDASPVLSCLMDGDEVFSKSDFTCAEAESAPFHRLLAVGKKWNQCHTDACTPAGDYAFDYEIKGDTVIGGVRHYKLFAHNYENKGGEKELGLLLEANKRVYSIWTDMPGNPNTLLYDFGIGEDEKPGFHYPLKVRSIVCDETRRGGNALRRLGMGYEPWPGSSDWNPVHHPLDWWVEGVGSSTDFIMPYAWAPSRHCRLESCTLDGDTLFTFDDFQIPVDVAPDMPEADYHPMLVEGKSWLYHYTLGHSDSGEMWQTAYEVTYTLRGDTVIGGVNYMKMYEEHEGRCHYHSAWREEGRKVHVAYPGKPDSLCYDYGLPYLGQAPYTLHDDIHEPLYLAAKDVVMAGGDYHNRFWFIDDMYEEGHCWVDGVGCENGLLYPDRPTNFYMPNWHFVSCTMPDGETITALDLMGGAVEYDGGIQKIASPTRHHDDGRAYDLGGRLVTSPIPGHVYIRNGRKYVK